ncbi:ladderlectin-like [Amphiprion ocellaris]|uniref:ladderlectin-like n=1 Tax=Amphiprion ocellaris TaxID=80972 RepID=UPI0024117B94|nr:ladderlectin-like [Amphiprion ocellaris]
MVDSRRVLVFSVPPPIQSYCLGFGANLASVHSLEQYNWLRSMIKGVTQGNPETWIGGSDCQQVYFIYCYKTSFWSDGTPFKYSFWGPGQPDNSGGGQDCLQMNWGDVRTTPPSVGPLVFCGAGLTVGLLGVAAGIFFFIKGHKRS